MSPTVLFSAARIIGATATVNGVALRVVAHEGGDLVLQRASPATASGGSSLAASDFDDVAFALAALQPQPGTSGAGTIRTECFYGLPTAKVIDERNSSYDSTHGVQLVSAVQEDHITSDDMTLSVRLPAEFRHNERDATRGTVNSLVFTNPGSMAYSNEQVTITDDKNRFPLIAAAGESLASDSALELRHASDATKNIDGAVKSVSLTSGGKNYADGQYVLDGGNLNATLTSPRRTTSSPPASPTPRPQARPAAPAPTTATGSTTSSASRPATPGTAPCSPCASARSRTASRRTASPPPTETSAAATSAAPGRPRAPRRAPSSTARAPTP